MNGMGKLSKGNQHLDAQYETERHWVAILQTKSTITKHGLTNKEHSVASTAHSAPTSPLSPTATPGKVLARGMSVSCFWTGAHL